MGSADFYADGQWNFFCDLCGRKEKSSIGRKTWNNFYVCARHKEIRNPQDFVRGIKDIQTVPWNRSHPPDIFVQSCTLRGANAIPDYAVPNCCIPDFINLTFVQEALPEGPWLHSNVVLAIPNFAIPNYAIPDNINRGGNDLSYVFDSIPTGVVRVQSTVPGHTNEFFLRAVP